MKVIMFRHGVAEDYNERGDEERGLTEGGIRRLKKAAKGLRLMLKGSKRVFVYSSPIRRARQTADLLTVFLRADDMFLRDEIAEGRFEELYFEWDDYRGEPAIVVVGHEPQLGRWLERLTGQRMKFARGAAAMVDIADITEVSGAKFGGYLSAEMLGQIYENTN